MVSSIALSFHFTQPLAPFPNPFSQPLFQPPFLNPLPQLPKTLVELFPSYYRSESFKPKSNGLCRAALRGKSLRVRRCVPVLGTVCTTRRDSENGAEYTKNTVPCDPVVAAEHWAKLDEKLAPISRDLKRYRQRVVDALKSLQDSLPRCPVSRRFRKYSNRRLAR